MNNTTLLNLSLEPQHLINLHKKGYAWNKIATFYNVSERTLYRKIKTSDQPKQTTGRKGKITQNILPLLRTYIEQNNTATQQDMINFLTQQMDFTIHQSNMSRLLKRERITHKKATKQFTELDKEKAKQFVADNHWLLSLDSTYAIDECGFNLGGVPRYAYASSDCRAVVKRLGQRGYNQTLFLCIQNINQKVMISHKLIKGGAKSKDFHNFLSNIEFPAKGKKYVLLDNARIHHATKSCQKLGLSTIRELAVEKNIKFKYLTAYAPQLNPVELCINFIRQYVNKCRARSEEKLVTAVSEAIKLLQAKDLTKYFQKCFDYFSDKNKL